MRILFILPSIPYPPSDGGKTKVFNLLKYLSPRHQCDLICLGVASHETEEGLRAALPQIGSVRVIPYRPAISRYVGAWMEVLCLNPPSLARFASRELQDLLSSERASGKYDVVHYDIINMAQYHTEPADVASVHSPNDANSYLYFRLARATPNYLLKCKLYLSAMLLRRYERKLYGSFSKIHVVSDDDKRYLDDVAANLDVEAIPVSSGYPYDLSARARVSSRKTEGRQGPVVVVCGNLGDDAIARGFLNFLQEVFPCILKEFPDVRLRVLGRSGAADLFRRIQHIPGIECFAWVENFETFITDADVVLVPDMAGAPGAKTRVVQAMALGMAVVGSEAAFEGIPAITGVHGMIYQTSEQCGASLLDLLKNEGRRRQLGAAAAVLAANEYSLDRIGPKYEALYYAATERHSKLANQPPPSMDARHSRSAP